MQVKCQPFVHQLKKLKNPRWDNSQYCRFHKDIGHSTEGFQKFKDEIEHLTKKGYLHEFINNPNHSRQSHKNSGNNNYDYHGQSSHPEKEINLEDKKSIKLELCLVEVILILPTKCSFVRPSLAQKFYKLLLHITQGNILNLQAHTSFSERKAHRLIHTYVDALVVTIQVSNITLHRILIDISNSTDVLFSESWKQMTFSYPLK